MVELIPREVLFGNPERVSPRISADGSRLAWIAPHEGVLNVWIAPSPSGETSPGDDATGGAGRVGAPDAAGGLDEASAIVVTDDRDRGIRTFTWAHDGRHLLYLQDSGGDENWRLFDVDVDSMERRDLTPYDAVQTQLIAADKRFPSEVLIGLNRDNPELHDVYRLDLESGTLAKEVDNPGFIGWVADADLVVRAGVAPTAEGGFILMVRDGNDGEWRPLVEVPPEDSLTTQPLTFSLDGDSLLAVSSIGANTSRLVRIGLTDGNSVVLAEDPDADVTDVELDPDTREPRVVVILKERSDYRVLDESVAADLEAIRALHPGDPVFEGGDDGDDTWLVGFTTDTGPMPYFSYNRREKSAQFLFEHQPALARTSSPRWSPSRSRAATASGFTAT